MWIGPHERTQARTMGTHTLTRCTLKLADVTGADAKTTLLHFVVEEIIDAHSRNRPYWN